MLQTERNNPLAATRVKDIECVVDRLQIHLYDRPAIPAKVKSEMWVIKPQENQSNWQCIFINIPGYSCIEGADHQKKLLNISFMSHSWRIIIELDEIRQCLSLRVDLNSFDMVVAAAIYRHITWRNSIDSRARADNPLPTQGEVKLWL